MHSGSVLIDVDRYSTSWAHRGEMEGLSAPLLIINWKGALWFFCCSFLKYSRNSTRPVDNSICSKRREIRGRRRRRKDQGDKKNNNKRSNSDKIISEHCWTKFEVLPASSKITILTSDSNDGDILVSPPKFRGRPHTIWTVDPRISEKQSQVYFCSPSEPSS